MTFHERDKHIRRCWGMGLNTYQIGRILELPECYVERVVFDHVRSKKKKKEAA